MDEKLENYRLEIIVLQQRDEADAVACNFKTKREWFDYICKQKEDEVAQAIIDIAEKYEVPISRVAWDFDPSMLFRVIKFSNNQKNKGAFKKAA